MLTSARSDAANPQLSYQAFASVGVPFGVRDGSSIVLTPLPGLGIFITPGGIAELDRRVQRGKRFLRGVLALAVSLIGAGIYSMLG